MVVKITVPFWIPIIILPLIFRVPKKGPHFDNHPHVFHCRAFCRTRLLLSPERSAAACWVLATAPGRNGKAIVASCSPPASQRTANPIDMKIDPISAGFQDWVVLSRKSLLPHVHSIPWRNHFLKDLCALGAWAFTCCLGLQGGFEAHKALYDFPRKTSCSRVLAHGSLACKHQAYLSCFRTWTV